MDPGALCSAQNAKKTSWTLSMLSMGWPSNWTSSSQTWMEPGPCSQSHAAPVPPKPREGDPEKPKMPQRRSQLHMEGPKMSRLRTHTPIKLSVCKMHPVDSSWQGCPGPSSKGIFLSFWKRRGEIPGDIGTPRVCGNQKKRSFN